MKLVKGMARTMRSCLERELGFRVPARHPLIAWLVRHAANTLTWVVNGHDGRTAYQRIRGKPFRTTLLTFGEQCRCKLRSQEPFSASGDGRRFHVGTYVGVDRRTGQYMIHVGDGIQYARTVMRLPGPNKWEKDRLAEIKATPWSLHVPKDPEVIFMDKKDAEPMTAADKLVISRQLYFKASDFVKYGLTRGCPKCDHGMVPPCVAIGVCARV